MARLALLLLLSAVIVATASDDPTVSLAGVHDLTPSDFDKVVTGAKHALVEFYAPWCGHCKRMTPEYKTLGELVQADPMLKSRIVIAKVNADDHRELGTRFDVGGFPTIKYFPRGKAPTKENALPYEGARTSDKFLEFLKKKLDEDKGFARIEGLDAVAKKWAAADKAAKAKLVAEAEAAVGKLEEEVKKNGELYVTFMKRALDKGDEYFGKELARLERMLATGSVAAPKVDEMARKTSVLSSFTEAAADTDEE